MINILIPLGGQSVFFENSEYLFPKPLIEINGKPMIQHVIENLSIINEEKRFIFILREDDCTRYHLDDTLHLLSIDNGGSIIIKYRGQTSGAACTALLAIKHISDTQPLIIVNGDQILNVDLNAYLTQFRDSQSDAGCLTFESVHPRWSFVRIEDDGNIIEAAEKHPISRHAIAGFYYFAKGIDFVEAAKHSIRKNASVNNVYYIAPVFNELILLNRKLKAFPLPTGSFHTFYSPKKISDYEIGVNIN